MLAILFSWSVILFIFLSFGDFFALLYSKFSKRNEHNSFIELVILGMFFCTLILSISSLWLPSNQYIMFFFVAISILYWVSNKDRFIQLWQRIKNYCRAFSLFHWILFMMLVASVLFYIITEACSIDARVYYVQATLWNEQYPAVRGLANIEERLGNNSSLYLISSIFTFRFIFDDPLFTVHSLILTLLLIWTLYEVITSKFELKRIILFVLTVVYIRLFATLGSITADAFCSGIILYSISRAILYPQQQKNKYLYYFIIAVFLVTAKLSSSVICLMLCIYLLYIMITKKEHKSITFIFISAFLFIAFWCIRNVILSGYLIYPVYQIDLFSFDWKVPAAILQKEQEYIKVGFSQIYGFIQTITYTARALPYVGKYYEEYACVSLYVFSIISIVTISVAMLNKKIREKTDNMVLYLFLSLIASIAFWLCTSPLIRFISGNLFSLIFMCFAILLTKQYYFKKVGYCVVIITVALYLNSSFKTVYRKDYSQMALTPLNIYQKSGCNQSDIVFDIYKLNDNVSIYLSRDKVGYTYDKVPCVIDLLPENSAWRFQDYRLLEARGNTIADGFRYRDE